MHATKRWLTHLVCCTSQTLRLLQSYCLTQGHFTYCINTCNEPSPYICVPLMFCKIIWWALNIWARDKKKDWKKHFFAISGRTKNVPRGVCSCASLLYCRWRISTCSRDSFRGTMTFGLDCLWMVTFRNVRGTGISKCGSGFWLRLMRE